MGKIFFFWNYRPLFSNFKYKDNLKSVIRAMMITTFLSRRCTILIASVQISERVPIFWLEPFSKNGGYLLSHLRSTIGVSGLNFSVRNGKRWNPAAIGHLKYGMTYPTSEKSILLTILQQKIHSRRKSLGQLVVLGFDVTVFTPSSYHRHRRWRHSREI